MPSEIHRLRERREAIARLREIRRNAQTAFAIHYSCESFYDTVDGRTPRISSISLRRLANGQTHSFSIHKLAEHKGYDLADIPGYYVDLEREMLNEFFKFMHQYPGYVFVHWNIRDVNFGFPALEHRFKVLGGDPYIVPDEKKYDLARALVSIYSHNYIGHGSEGRFLNVCRLNNITDKDALTGAQEAEAFTSQQYLTVHLSTLRKVDMITVIFERAEDRSLKTKASWRDVHGLHPKHVVECVKESWFYASIAIIATIVGLLGRVLGWWFAVL